MKREGFWQSSMEPDLPQPQASDERWRGQEEFLFNLLRVEESFDIKDIKRYRGLSICRLCNRSNGNAEYETKEWNWPSGLKHYILFHNVKPSNEFINYITDLSEKLSGE